MRLLGWVLLAVGCGEPIEVDATHERAVLRRFRQTCPMMVRGAQVRLEETPTGAALTFTTSGEVDLLREAVVNLAGMYETDPTGRRIVWGDVEGDRDIGMRGIGEGAMPALKVEVDDVPGGARISLTPLDPADLEQLRTMALLHQKRLASNQCWIYDVVSVMGGDSRHRWTPWQPRSGSEDTELEQIFGRDAS